MVTFPDAARRARLVSRHRLGARHRPKPSEPTDGAASVVQVAASLVGLHATDPASPFLSAWARLPGFVVADLEEAAYGTGAVTKHLGMRRTLFVQAADVVPVVQAACTDAIVTVQRRRLAADVEKAGIDRDGARWLDRAGAAVLAALAELGPTTGAALSRAVPEIQAKITYAEGKPWGGDVGVATRVFTILAAEGRIRRGPPTGGWTSSQHRWQLAAVAPPALSEADAVRRLAERWLQAFGPATVDDLVWWTGVGITKVRRALAEVDAVEVDLDGVTGIVLTDDLGQLPPAPPAVALLPALDPTTMGWKHRGWYLGDLGPRLFDRNGNAGPTIWYGGRVVGGWSQRRSGEVVHRVLCDIGAEGRAAVEAEAAELEQWLGGTVVTPRFPTPLDRELRG